MAQQGRRQKQRPVAPSEEGVRALAARMARAETLTRVVCLVLGVVLAAGAVAFFVVVIRLSPRAFVGALIGALLIVVPTYFLLRRGLTGQDVDRYDLQELADRNIKIRWRP